MKQLLLMTMLVSITLVAQAQTDNKEQDFKAQWAMLDAKMRMQDSLGLDMRKRSNGFHHQIKTSFMWFGLSTVANLAGWGASRIWTGDNQTVSNVFYGLGIGLGVAGGVTFADAPRWFNQDKKALPLDRYPLPKQ